MKIVICTLFEQHYHYGVAALINSLIASGFRGYIYAGHRGPLPSWASFKLPATTGIEIIFLSLDTTSHLTNYKPDFIRSLIEGPAQDAEAIFYFDPDILVVTLWSFFIEWVSCGIALSEDVNSPLAENHPRRIGWRRFYQTKGWNLGFRSDIYVNGGFLGIRRDAFSFVRRWQSLNNLMGDFVGGLAVAKIEGGKAFTDKGFADCFDSNDQDSLNATIEVSPDLTFSLLSQSCMGFRAGVCHLPHALGLPKPWQKKYLSTALNGFPPTRADKEFWRFVDGPIKTFAPATVLRKQFQLKIAAALGRFIRRT